jgi:hypothetical protein
LGQQRLSNRQLVISYQDRHSSKFRQYNHSQLQHDSSRIWLQTDHFFSYGMTIMMAADLRGSNILVNSACPGWVRTELGGNQAPLSAEQGADTPVWPATLPNGGPTGGFFRNRQPIPW